MMVMLTTIHVQRAQEESHRVFFLSFSFFSSFFDISLAPFSFFFSWLKNNTRTRKEEISPTVVRNARNEALEGEEKERKKIRKNE